MKRAGLQHADIPRWWLAFLPAFVVALLLPPLQAQQNSDNDDPDLQQIEEILITAGKRGTTDRRHVPIAISTVSGSQLDWRNARNFNDLALLLPSVQFQDLGPGDKEYIIRGVNANGPAAVGAYFDEIVITATDEQDGGGKNADIHLVDMERIEVLNGPQGTLYGANSMAGTVRFITRKPNPEDTDAHVKFSLGNTAEGSSNTNLEGMLNLPVGDRTALRLVGWSKDDSGWIDQPTFEGGARSNINSVQTIGTRIMLRHTPAGGKFTLDVMALNQQTEVGGASRYTPAGVPNFCGTPASILNDADITNRCTQHNIAAFTPSEDYQNTDLTIQPRLDDVELLGITATFLVGKGSITATTGSYVRDIAYTFDSTWINFVFDFAPGVTHEPQSRTARSTEIRYASEWDGNVQMVAGYYSYEEDSQFEVQVVDTDGAGGRAPFTPGKANSMTTFHRTRNDVRRQSALFGELSIDLGEGYRLILGSRSASVDTLTSLQTTPHDFGRAGTPSDPLSRTFTLDQNPNNNNDPTEEDNTGNSSLKISLHRQINNQLDAFITRSEGFRAGGINNSNQPFAPDIPSFYDSDSLINVEVGIKNHSDGGHWYGEWAMYRMKWSDIQIEPRDPQTSIPYIVNGGSADMIGSEISLEYRPNEQLSLHFGGSYNDASLATDQPLILVGGGGQAITPENARHANVGRAGDAMPNVPKIQLYLALDTFWNVGGNPLRFGVEWAYRGKTDTQFRTDSPFNIALDAYSLINARVAYRLTDNWRISAYINNLTNEQAAVDGIFNIIDTRAVVGARPQTTGIAMDWRF